MTGKKAFFIECKHHKAPDWARCDKCGMKIAEQLDGTQFFNPNPKAHDRNICRKCYDVWSYNRTKKHEKWLEKQRVYEAEKNAPAKGKIRKCLDIIGGIA